MRKPDLARLLDESAVSEQSKVDLLGLTFDLLGQYADLYKGLDGFIELYDPVVLLLDGVKADSMPSGLSVSGIRLSHRLHFEPVALGQAVRAAGHRQSSSQILTTSTQAFSSPSAQANPYPDIHSPLRTNVIQLPTQPRPRPRAERDREAQGAGQAGTQGRDSRAAQGRSLPRVGAAEETEGEGPFVQRAHEACVRFVGERARRGEGHGEGEVERQEACREEVDHNVVV